MKAKVLILTGYGINCDLETEYAFGLAGAYTERIHINELIVGKKTLDDFHILALPGGFAHGDFLGAGKALALKLGTKLGDQILKFIHDGKLMIGICNGFQVLVRSGLLPGFDGNYKTQRTTLMRNDRGIFEDRWVHMKINSNSPCIWTRDMDHIELPVRHSEGKFQADDKMLDRLMDQGQVVAQYAFPDNTPAGRKYPLNPNGSPRDIGAICDPTGRIFGIMPHPEAYLHFTNHPCWTRLRETKKRSLQGSGSGLVNSNERDGIKIFRNAVEYINEKMG